MIDAAFIEREIARASRDLPMGLLCSSPACSFCNKAAVREYAVGFGRDLSSWMRSRIPIQFVRGCAEHAEMAMEEWCHCGGPRYAMANGLNCDGTPEM